MSFRYPATGVYEFATQTGADSDAFLYTAAHTGVPPDQTLPSGAGTQRRWCHETNDTGSTNVGPESGPDGDPDGYIYTEMSQGSGDASSSFGDEFWIEKESGVVGVAEVYDASSQDITVEFKTNQRGNDNDATCFIETNEDGGGWVQRGATFGGPSDPDKVGTNVAQIWSQRSVDLTGLISDASTRIRIKIVMPASGTVWHNDYGICHVMLEGIDQATSNIAGTADGTSTADATLSAKGGVSGATGYLGVEGGYATADATLSAKGVVSGQADGTSTASGAISSGTASGQADGTSSASISLVGRGSVSGATGYLGVDGGYATATAALSGRAAVSGQADGTSTAIASVADQEQSSDGSLAMAMLGSTF